jgi:hypothetical protein
MNIRYIPLRLKCSVLLAIAFLMAGRGMEAQKVADDLLNPLFIQVDRLGNMYEVASSHILKKYNADGEYLSQYSHPDYLDFNQVDVRDPYKITLFFKDQQKIVILDNALNYLSEIDLSVLEDRYIQLLCRTVDGLFCLFDQNQQQVLLVDDNLQQQSESFPLYQEGIEEFTPLSLLAGQNRIVLAGEEGLLVLFDHLGNFERTLLLEKFEGIQLINDRLLIFRSNTILVYNFFSFEESLLYEGTEDQLTAFKLDPKRNELQVIGREAPFTFIKSIKIP